MGGTMSELSDDAVRQTVYAASWRPQKARSNVRLLSHYVSPWAMAMRLIEFLLLVTALLGAQTLRLEELKDLAWLHSLVYAAVCVAALQAMELYSQRRIAVPDMLVRLGIAYGGSVACLTLLYYLVPQLFNGRGVMGIAVGVSIVASFAIRQVAYQVAARTVRPTRVMIIAGADGSLSGAVESIVRRMGDGAEYVGAYRTDAGELLRGEGKGGVPCSLMQAVESVMAGEIVVASRDDRRGAGDDRRSAASIDDLLKCKMMGVAVTDAVSFIEREERLLRIDAMRPSWLVFNQGFGHTHFQDFAKRLLDVVVSSVVLIVTLPISLLAAMAIIIESGWPLFYTQERVGYAGKTFKVIKFRSMRADAERDGRPQWAAKNDNRVTRVGRFIRMTRIDELPQLFNVLRGEMSFVGPRPERPFFVEKLRETVPHYDLRHFAKPGLTGWSQVKYPYGASEEDALAKLQYDLYYVKNRSLMLDLIVICATVHTIVFARGAR